MLALLAECFAFADDMFGGVAGIFTCLVFCIPCICNEIAYDFTGMSRILLEKERVIVFPFQVDFEVLGGGVKLELLACFSVFEVYLEGVGDCEIIILFIDFFDGIHF